MSKQRAKFSWPMVILASITLVLSSWGLFELAHVYGQMPAALAIVAVAGFDLTAVAAGNHALTVADDGDSSGPWNLLVIAAAFTSAVLQFMHTHLAGQPWPVGVLMAAFPVATVALFEGTVRRVHRLNGRRTGRIAKPRATFELIQWLIYPAVTFWAFRRSIADRSLGSDAAFMLAIQARTPAEETAEEAPDTRRRFEWDYSDRTGGQIREVTGGSPADAPDAPADAPESAEPTPDARPLTVLVRESLQVTNGDRDAATARVLELRPDAKLDTIRRTIAKESGLRVANG